MQRAIRLREDPHRFGRDGGAAGFHPGDVVLRRLVEGRLIAEMLRREVDGEHAIGDARTL